MTSDELLDQAIALSQRRGRVTYGVRKRLPALYLDLKGSMELLAERDPEETCQRLDLVIEHMIVAVHRYEGTVSQGMGDDIMTLFDVPLAHEDHAVREGHAAFAMQGAVQQRAAEVQRINGVPIRIRVGLSIGIAKEDPPCTPVRAGRSLHTVLPVLPAFLSRPSVVHSAAVCPLLTVCRSGSGITSDRAGGS